jgi:hypothetical protein
MADLTLFGYTRLSTNICKDKKLESPILLRFFMKKHIGYLKYFEEIWL